MTYLTLFFLRSVFAVTLWFAFLSHQPLRLHLVARQAAGWDARHFGAEQQLVAQRLTDTVYYYGRIGRWHAFDLDAQIGQGAAFVNEQWIFRDLGGGGNEGLD